MLANLVPKPFHRPGWVYEEKYDGYRILAYKEGAKVTLRSRNDHDRTATFAGVARAVGQLQDRSVLLDGEVVAFDSKGVSRFQLFNAGTWRKASQSSIVFIVMVVIYGLNRSCIGGASWKPRLRIQSSSSLRAVSRKNGLSAFWGCETTKGQVVHTAARPMKSSQMRRSHVINTAQLMERAGPGARCRGLLDVSMELGL